MIGCRGGFERFLTVARESCAVPPKGVSDNARLSNHSLTQTRTAGLGGARMRALPCVCFTCERRAQSASATRKQRRRKTRFRQPLSCHLVWLQHVVRIAPEPREPLPANCSQQQLQFRTQFVKISCRMSGVVRSMRAPSFCNFPFASVLLSEPPTLPQASKH